MKIYFARHGQTDWNIQRKVQGATDIPLNETGLLQARQLSERLQEEHIDLEKIYTSRQIRAVQTAQIVNEQYHVGYEIVNGLEEMSLGDFEGHTWEEIEALYSKELEYWNANRRYHRSPNGESYQIVMERVRGALEYILAQHDTSSDKDLLIISHGAVILTLLMMKQNIPFDGIPKIAVENATPIMFDVEELKDIGKRI